MNCFKQLAYAVFMAFLCIIPVYASAQDEGRLIDIPNVENDTKDLSFTKALRAAFENARHIVYNEDDLNELAAQANVKANYWKEGKADLIKRVNQKARHDALITFVHKKSSKSSTLVFNIYNAYTGEMIQDFELKTKSKGKLQKADTNKIVKAVNSIVYEIDPNEYARDVTIKIISTPSGAEVSRNGLVIGTTPLEVVLPGIDSEELEQWTLSYPDRDPVMQNISLARSASYNVNIPALQAENVDTDRFIGKVKSGYGRPIFSIGFNGAPTIRRLKSHDVDNKNVFSYRTKLYGTYSFDMSFFPMALASENEYLQGLGLAASVGFGFLDSSLQINSTKSSEQQCTIVNDDGSVATVSCDTSYVRANIDLLYRLLINKKMGKLDPNGIYFDFLFGYNMSSFKLTTNPLYLGHVYHGLDLGVRFSAPLGMDAFRFDANFDGYLTLSNGGINMIKKWGSRIDKPTGGFRTGAGFSYDVFQGLYFKLGYEFTYFKTQYLGNGCLNSECSKPKDAQATDYYHEIQIGVGYALY